MNDYQDRSVCLTSTIILAKNVSRVIVTLLISYEKQNIKHNLEFGLICPRGV